MPRERRNFKRESFVRNIQRLFVIATEGIKTEIKYFDEFKSEQYFNNQSVFVEILKRLTTDSSPDVVIRELDSFAKEYRLREGDELWMVIDRDKQSWTQKEIARVARLCIQKNYGFALSNPCFEVWLLLHVKDFNSYSKQKQKALFINTKKANNSLLEIELRNLCGSYNKSNLAVAHYLPTVANAIVRSEALVQSPNERWPQGFGSHVFKLVKKLLP
jgi:hypothetical protein